MGRTLRMPASLLGIAAVGALSLATAAPAAAWPGADNGALTSARSLGANTASWDGNFLDADIPSLLEQADIGVLRYPGGSYADYYDWETNTANGQPDSVDWQQFSSIAEAAGATPFVTVNYGSGTPAEAAAWVATASSDPRLSGMLWEIGNEEYGPWETDDHPNPHTPQSYATYSAAFLQAMHQANPRAAIGFPYALTTQQAAGTGTGVADPDAWNNTILAQDGSQFAFADVHWYPFYGTPTLTSSQILDSVNTIPSVMRSIRETLAAHHSHAFVIVGESNISNAEIVYNVEPVAALYAAATSLEWISQGAKSYDWWDLHNYGTLQGDYGMLSSGTSGEPPVDTPFPSYYGYQLASLLTAPGSWLRSVPTGSPNVFEFRSDRGGDWAVMFVNSDSAHFATVHLGGRGRADHGDHAGTLSTFTYTAAMPQIVSGTTSARQLRSGIELAPQSIEVITGSSR